MGLFCTCDTSSIERKLDKVMNALAQLNDKVVHMASSLDNLTAAVGALVTAIDNAVLELDDLKAKLDAAIGSGADPVALQALVDQIGVATSTLAQHTEADKPA